MARTTAGRTSRRKNRDHSEPYVGQIVLVVALPEERGYFHSTVSNRAGWESTTETSRYRCVYQSHDGPVLVVVQTLPAMGLIEAVLGATSAIASSSPDLVIMIGIAGSLSPKKVGLGDVVISNRAKFYTADKVAVPDISPKKPPAYVFKDGDSDGKRHDVQEEIWIDGRDRFLSQSYLRYERKFVELGDVNDLLSRAEPVLRKKTLKQLDPSWIPDRFKDLESLNRQRQLFNGWLLGSHHVVDSAEYRDYLVQKNTSLELDVHRQTGDSERVRWTDGELLAVDMESYGVLRAVQAVAGKPPSLGGSRFLMGGILVRGISDMCEEKSNTDRDSKNAIRQMAVENATEIGLSLIEGLDYDRILMDRQGR